MTKAQLIDKISRRTGLSRLETRAAFVAFWETIEEALSEDDSIELRGYGSFRIQNRPARNVRNPSTGETMRIESKKVPVFKPSKDLKDRINQEGSG